MLLATNDLSHETVLTAMLLDCLTTGLPIGNSVRYINELLVERAHELIEQRKIAEADYYAHGMESERELDL